MKRITNGGMIRFTEAVWVRQLMLTLMVCTALGFQTGCDNDDEPGIENASLYVIDRDFLEQAAQSNLSEIELGQLALQKATDADVKAYAQQMVDDHTVAQNELKTLGMNKQWFVPTQLNELNQAKKEQLSALSGAEFDAAYIRGQVSAHQVTAGKFQMELDNGRNTELKEYANKYKLAIDLHLEMAQDIMESKNY